MIPKNKDSEIDVKAEGKSNSSENTMLETFERSCEFSVIESSEKILFAMKIQFMLKPMDTQFQMR